MDDLISRKALLEQSFVMDDEDGFPTSVVLESDVRHDPTIQQPEWISCAERLPEDDERVIEHKDFRLSLRSVLVHDKERGVLIANRYKVVACGTVCLDELVTDGWVWSNNAQNVTHWMPLPLPPKEGE